jgi:DNA-binding response OmpR family regulator
VNIAILEDNPSILDYLTAALQMNGHRVRTFTQGTALLEALFPLSQMTTPSTSLPFDLILVDLLLPGELSGLQVIQTIRSTIPHERLPIIIVSASGTKELQQAQAEVPYTPAIRKPFKIQELLRMIDNVKV